jgi:hypothetical protein
MRRDDNKGEPDRVPIEPTKKLRVNVRIPARLSSEPLPP